MQDDAWADSERVDTGERGRGQVPSEREGREGGDKKRHWTGAWDLDGEAAGAQVEQPQRRYEPEALEPVWSHPTVEVVRADVHTALPASVKVSDMASGGYGSDHYPVSCDVLLRCR